MKRFTAFRACLAAMASLTIVGASPAQAEPTDLFGNFGDIVTWYHLYSADDGFTHIEEMKVPAAEGPKGLKMVFERNATRAFLGYWPHGRVSDFHYSGNTNILIYLQGTQILDLGQGKTFRLPSGVAVLAENWAGQGHKATCEAPTGKKVCMVLQVTVGPTEKRLPLRKAP